MVDSLFANDGYRAAKVALDGLSLRQKAIGHNIANVDTPGYRASTVDFESAVRLALQRSEQISLATTHTGHIALREANAGFSTQLRTGGSVRADGNNVDLDTELIDMSAAGIQYQAVSQEVSKKLLLLRAIASAR